MARENFTAINVIIDKSGSMSSLTNDTIGGFNRFLNEQKSLPEEAIFTLCLFNDKYEMVYESVPLSEIPDLNYKSYRPCGSTALLDAIGSTIDSVGKKLDLLSEDDKPSKVIFLIMTDGEENASREYSLSKVKEMISHQREKYSWEFVFIGANIDAVSVGTSFGVAYHNSYTYESSSAGTNEVYDTMSRGLTRYRSAAVKQTAFFDSNKDDTESKDKKS